MCSLPTPVVIYTKSKYGNSVFKEIYLLFERQDYREKRERKQENFHQLIDFPEGSKS